MGAIVKQRKIIKKRGERKEQVGREREEEGQDGEKEQSREEEKALR